MRRYLWIIVSLVLPLAFLIVMKTRPPQSPGIEVRVPPSAGIDGKGELTVQADGIPAAAASAQDGGVDGGQDGGR